MQAYINSLGETMVVAALLLFALAAVLLVWGVGSLVAQSRDATRRRLDEFVPASGVRTPGALDKLATRLGPLGSALLPSRGRERDRIERLLFLANLRSPTAASTFFGVKTVLMLGLPALWLLVSQYFPTMSTNRVWFIAAVFLLIGMIGPNRWLEKRAEARQMRLKNGFPDALDLLVICVESGLGLAAAIERVAQELRFSHPDLADELALVNAQMRAGVEREVALKSLSERTGLKDVKGLVSLLVQTMRFGTSVADTLRVFSEEYRDQRMQAAEEQAAKVGTKLIFPLVLCMFPSFFVISVGPALISVMDAFGRAPAAQVTPAPR